MNAVVKIAIALVILLVAGYFLRGYLTGPGPGPAQQVAMVDPATVFDGLTAIVVGQGDRLRNLCPPQVKGACYASIMKAEQAALKPVREAFLTCAKGGKLDACIGTARDALMKVQLKPL